MIKWLREIKEERDDAAYQSLVGGKYPDRVTIHRSSLDRLIKLVEAAEWGGREGTKPRCCPICGGNEYEGHGSICLYSEEYKED